MKKSAFLKMTNRKISEVTIKEIVAANITTTAIVEVEKDTEGLMIYEYSLDKMFQLDFLPTTIIQLGKDDYQGFYRNIHEAKWSHKRASMLISGPSKTTYIKPSQLELIEQFTGKKINDLVGYQSDNYKYLIENYQCKCNRKIGDIKQNKKNKPIDELMEKVPKLPKNFFNWIEQKVFKENSFIVYNNRKAGKIYGFCTHCKKEIELKTDARHGDNVICPKCKTTVQLKAEGRIKGGVYISDWCFLIQKIGETQLVVRAFFVNKTINNSNYQEVHPKINYTESIRAVFDENSKMQIYTWWKERGQLRWCLGEKNISWFMVSTSTIVQPGYCYPYNLKQIFKGTSLEYIHFDELNRQRKEIPYWCFEAYKETPQLELIQKLKWPSLYQYVRNNDNYKLKSTFNLEGKNLFQFINLPNHYAKRVIEGKKDVNQIQFYKTLVRLGIKNASEDEFEELLKYNDKCGNHKFEFIYKKIGSHRKMLNYINKQDMEQIDAFNIWYDYLSISETLDKKYKQREFNVASFPDFPRQLITLHDEVNELLAEERDKEGRERRAKEDNAIKLLEDTFKNYTYEDHNLGLTLTYPTSVDDFIKESAALSHCVRGYVHSTIQGKSYIFFIRKTSDIDTPYFTMEYNPSTNKILQLRGYKNCSYPDSVSKFKDHWLQKISKPRKGAKITDIQSA